MEGKSLRVRAPYSDYNKAKNIPQRRWLKEAREWSCRPSLANMEYIRNVWPGATWDLPSQAHWSRAQQEKQMRARVAARDIDMNVIAAEIARGLFRTPAPWEHQSKAVLLGRDMPYFAYIMDTGTGKTRVVCDDAAHNYRKARIDTLLVVNKNSVKTNWVSGDVQGDAIAAWLPQDIPGEAKTVWMRDRWVGPGVGCVINSKFLTLSINFEAIISDDNYDMLEKLCKERKVMIVADESTMLGKAGSERTKRWTKIRKLCPVARILTGTPIVKSPLKAFSQFGFLSEDILGFGSFFAFKARYTIMGGYKGKQVLKYINLEELSEKIAACSFRVTKDQCMDLPPAVYQKRTVYMTKEQAAYYADMRKKMLAIIDGKDVSATIKLTQIMRLQQITGGYVKADDGTEIEIVSPEKNPLIKEVLGIMEEAGDQKVIVWAHYKREIEALHRVLTAKGYKVAMFYGDTPEADRLEIRRAFARGEYDGIIAQEGTGGVGIDEFKRASISVFYSNSYDTEARIQAEGRTMRGGSEIHEKITYIDLMIPNTVRVKIVATLRANKLVSDEVMRDNIREWI